MATAEAAATEAEAALAEAAREAPWSALLAATAEEEEDGSEGSEPPTCRVEKSALETALLCICHVGISEIVLKAKK